MIFIAFALVLLSALVHACWNLFAKQSINKITFLWLIHIISFFMLLPYFLIKLPEVELQGYVILSLLLSMMFQIFYVISIHYSYTLGDLSQTYPILRGSASVFVPVASLIFFQESLSPIGWIGILVMLFGIFLMSRSKQPKADQQQKAKLAMLIAVGGGISITGYTLNDKILLQTMEPLMIIQFQNIFHSLAFLWGSLHSGHPVAEWKKNWKIILLGALFMPGSYLLFLFALQLAQVSQLAPMREINIVFGAILGTLILKERNGRQKFISSAFIVLGIMILGFFG